MLNVYISRVMPITDYGESGCPIQGRTLHISISWWCSVLIGIEIKLKIFLCGRKEGKWVREHRGCGGCIASHRSITAWHVCVRFYPSLTRCVSLWIACLHCSAVARRESDLRMLVCISLQSELGLSRALKPLCGYRTHWAATIWIQSRRCVWCWFVVRVGLGVSIWVVVSAFSDSGFFQGFRNLGFRRGR